MAEVFALGDRITVLRDGRTIDDAAPTADVTPDQLVAHDGRPRPSTRPIRASRGRQARRGAAGGQGPDRAAAGSPTSTSRCAAGEIVGLVRPGRLRPHARSRARSSAPTRSTAGEIVFDGKADLRRARSTPTRRGIGADPGEPQERRASRWRARSATISCLARCVSCSRAGCSCRAARASAARDGLIRQAAHRNADAAAGRSARCPAATSRRSCIGKWLDADAKLFIFDEPTRGIDVGAKSEIFRADRPAWCRTAPRC